MSKSKWSTRMLATGAICIAMSYLLSYIKLFSMPTGGSVTAASMFPLMAFAYLYGVGPGLFAGLAYGLLQFIQEPYIYHWIQIIIDYPLAFAMLGLAGCFRKTNKPWAFPAGTVLACFGRFLCHLFTGMVFFGEYAPAADFVSIFLYSAGYNGGYMAVEAVITVVIASLPPVQSMIRRLEKA